MWYLLLAMPKSKAELLKRVADELKRSTCPLRTTATNPVPGEGNPDAELFLIGEAPGRNEDLTGRPFVGAAGKMLEELLSTIGLRRENVFITSIEKFRPPKNRAPKSLEIAACFPYLERQINVIKPKFVVTLGRHALQRMLEWDGSFVPPLEIDKLHGKPIKSRHGFVIFPMYHPAAILYNRKLKNIVEADFKKLSSLLEP